LAANYGLVKVNEFLSYNDLLSYIKPVKSDKPKAVEMLDIGPNYGQNFGFTVYRTKISKSNNMKLSGNQI